MFSGGAYSYSCTHGGRIATHVLMVGNGLLPVLGLYAGVGLCSGWVYTQGWAYAQDGFVLGDRMVLYIVFVERLVLRALSISPLLGVSHLCEYVSLSLSTSPPMIP